MKYLRLILAVLAVGLLCGFSGGGGGGIATNSDAQLNSLGIGGPASGVQGDLRWAASNGNKVAATVDTGANLSVGFISNSVKAVFAGVGGFKPGLYTVATLPSCTSSLEGDTAVAKDNDAACVLNAAPAHSTCTVGTNCHTCSVLCGASGGASYAWKIY